MPPKRLPPLLAFMAGALSVTAFAPFSLWPAAILMPAVLFRLLTLEPRRGFLLGWAYGLGLMLFGVFWLRNSIGQFGGIGLPLALLLTLLFVLFMALFFGLFGWLATRLSSRSKWVLVLFVPGLWVLVEWFRGWVLGGFPWLALGYSQLATPLAGYAPLLGVFGVSLAVAVSAALLSHWRAVHALPLVLLWLGGWGAQQLSWSEPTGEPFQVSLVQGGIDQEDKWKPQNFFFTIERYLGLTEQVSDSRLVLWPETAVPAFAHRVETTLLQPLEQLLAERGGELLLGIPIAESEGRYFNAMLRLGTPERGHYYKRHLVPFGEFMPLVFIVGPLTKWLAIPMSDFTAGEAAQPLLTLAGHPAGISICYEDAFGGEMIEALPQAAFFVNASNDAWFGDSLAPHQHLEIARMRALEAERYLLRATNTGVSAIIGAKGELLRTGPQFEPAVLSAEIRPLQGMTPFARIGDWGAVLIALGMAAVGWRLPRPVQGSALR